MTKARAQLIILDGYGIGKESPFNAIENSHSPFLKSLFKRYPHSQILTHGEYVGLPDGIMGNSEVGHMTLGSGRIVYQDLMRINRSIKSGDFFKNPILNKTIKAGKGRVHLLGLLSDGGVHSHETHLFALLELCRKLSIPEVYVHAFLDGRDTPPDSSPNFIGNLEPELKKSSAVIGSISGRYYAMDRDQRWERIDLAYDMLGGKCSVTPLSPLKAIEASHAAKKMDEFVLPVLLNENAAIRDGDAIVFFNFRSDRARQLSNRILSQKHFKPGSFCSMTEYDAKLGLPVAYAPERITHIFGEELEKLNLKQFRVAETEKYAHVTFFFNAGREAPFQGEDRVLIPSPKEVATYDLKPEMSAFEVAKTAQEKILGGHHDFYLMNFANADMVGHTGNYEAAVKAIEALDQCLEKVIGAAEKSGVHTILTADHGNAEEMCDHLGKPHTQHTLNPVPALWVPPKNFSGSTKVSMQDGTLADIAPTLCQLMGVPKPKEMTGKSLLP